MPSLGPVRGDVMGYGNVTDKLGLSDRLLGTIME